MKIADIILFESFPLAKKEFSQEADPSEVEQYISKYREYLKQSFISNEFEKDINYWRKLGYDDFKEFVDYTLERAKKSKEMKRMTKDYIVIEDTPTYRIVSPCSYAASRKLGIHSTWCTSSSDPTHFRDYFYRDGNIFAFFLPKSDYKDNFCIRYDVDKMSIAEVRDLTQNMTSDNASKYLSDNFGISPERIIDKVMAKFDIIDKVRKKNQSTDKEYDKDLHNILDRIRKRGFTDSNLPDGNLLEDLDEVSGYFLSDDRNDITVAVRILQAAFRYREHTLINYILKALVNARGIDVTYVNGVPENHGDGPDPRLYFLDSIVKYARKLVSIEVSACYANLILDHRWKELEQILIKDGNPELIFGYYRRFFNGERWIEAEHILLQSPFYSTQYAILVKERIPESENIIMQDPVSAYTYAYNILGVRWPEAEPYILKNPFVSFRYARDVIKGRWPEAEKVILQEMDPENIEMYAHQIIKGRWIDAEPIIFSNKECREYYARSFNLSIGNDKFIAGRK